MKFLKFTLVKSAESVKNLEHLASVHYHAERIRKKHPKFMPYTSTLRPDGLYDVEFMHEDNETWRYWFDHYKIKYEEVDAAIQTEVTKHNIIAIQTEGFYGAFYAYCKGDIVCDDLGDTVAEMVDLDGSSCGIEVLDTPVEEPNELSEAAGLKRYLVANSA
jgi:hypothetical protein